MKKSILLKLSILLLIVSLLAGCIWVEPVGYRHGGSHNSDHGKHRGNKH